MSKRFLPKLLGLILTISLFVILLRQFDYQAFSNSFRQTGWVGMLIVIIMHLISQILVYLQWYLVSKYQNCEVSFTNMVRINLQGTLTESITPGAKFGGEVVRIWLLRKLGRCTSAQAMAIVTAQKIFSMSAFIMLNLASWVYLTRRFDVLGSGYLSYLVVPILVALITLMLFTIINPCMIRAWLNKKRKGLEINQDTNFKNKIARFISFVDSGLGNLESMSRNRILLVKQFSLSLLIWLLYPIKIIILLRFMLPDLKMGFVNPNASDIQALSADVGFINIVLISAITFVAYMIAMLPIFPGGLGGFEASMAGMLSLAGLTGASAIAVAIMFRFVTFWIVVAAGLAVYLFFKARELSCAYMIIYKKIKRIIPNVLTMINLILGLVVIGSLFHEQINLSLRGAALLILIAAAIDGVDGTIARKLDSTTKLGAYLDSFADLTSFCIAPAAIIASTPFFQRLPLATFVIALYPIAGAYRLARYHVVKSSDSFTGVPVTVTGTIIALYILFLESMTGRAAQEIYAKIINSVGTSVDTVRLVLDAYIPLILVVILSGLMVCRHKFNRPNFNN